MADVFDALPHFFVAPVGNRYALFQTAAQTIPEQNFMYVSVIRPAPWAGFASAHAYTYTSVKQKAHTRQEGAAVIRDCEIQVEGIEVMLDNGPLRSAELITFFGREAEILPLVPNHHTFELRTTPGIRPRQFANTIAPMWEPPVAPPAAGPAGGAGLPIAPILEFPIQPLPRPPTPPAAPVPLLLPLLPLDFLHDPMPAPRNRPRVRSVSPPGVAGAGLPAHVKTILIEAAITKGEACPISLNPITKENAVVTSCGHVFDRDSIAQWLASSDTNGCPNCREHCVV